MCLSGQRKLHIKDKEILYNLGHLFEWLIDVVIDYLLTFVPILTHMTFFLQWSINGQMFMLLFSMN